MGGYLLLGLSPNHRRPRKSPPPPPPSSLPSPPSPTPSELNGRSVHVSTFAKVSFARGLVSSHGVVCFPPCFLAWPPQERLTNFFPVQTVVFAGRFLVLFPFLDRVPLGISYSFFSIFFFFCLDRHFFSPLPEVVSGQFADIPHLTRRPELE